jgi:hypothetical protein
MVPFIAHLIRSLCIPSHHLDRYIGLYGNSDPLDTSQWLEMTLSAPTGYSPSWDAATGVCSGIITSLDYQFLVMKTAERSDPQNKVVAAAASFATGDISMRYEAAYTDAMPCADSNNTPTWRYTRTSTHSLFHSPTHSIPHFTMRLFMTCALLVTRRIAHGDNTTAQAFQFSVTSTFVFQVRSTGVCMVHTWCIHGAYMVHTWCIHGA